MTNLLMRSSGCTGRMRKSSAPAAGKQSFRKRGKNPSSRKQSGLGFAVQVPGWSTGSASDNSKRREIAMKYLLMFASLTLASSLAVAQEQRKPCEELKAEIQAKIEAKGVKGFTLEIVPNENVKDEKVVGSCDGGTKKITYKRG